MPVGARLQTCAECHSDVTSRFNASAHLDTLHRSREEHVLTRFAGKSWQDGPDAPLLAYDADPGGLVLTADGAPLSFPVKFVFGSGRHGQTPLSVRQTPGGRTESLEHHLTWYPAHGLGLTIGHDPPQAAGILRFGQPMDVETTERCFGCHTSYLPKVQQALDLDRLVPGVRCNKCHDGLAEHVAAAERGEPFRDVWSRLSPLGSVRRCGGCHRTVEDFELRDLRPDNTALLRFAPVGLERSACFQRQRNRRLDCTTCHDPHARPPEDLSVYRRHCATCHDGVEGTECSSPSTGTDCLSCHMPKVAHSPYVSFTDHWIRVREPAGGE